MVPAPSLTIARWKGSAGGSFGGVGHVRCVRVAVVVEGQLGVDGGAVQPRGDLDGQRAVVLHRTG
jgi:hypothetical protein